MNTLHQNENVSCFMATFIHVRLNGPGSLCGDTKNYTILLRKSVTKHTASHTTETFLVNSALGVTSVNLHTIKVLINDQLLINGFSPNRETVTTLRCI